MATVRQATPEYAPSPPSSPNPQAFFPRVLNVYTTATHRAVSQVSQSVSRWIVHMTVVHLLERGHCQRLGLGKRERLAVALLQGALRTLASRADRLALVPHEHARRVAEKQLLHKKKQKNTHTHNKTNMKIRMYHTCTFIYYTWCLWGYESVLNRREGGGGV